jgi:hypothetical protein
MLRYNVHDAKCKDQILIKLCNAVIRVPSLNQAALMWQDASGITIA